MKISAQSALLQILLAATITAGGNLPLSAQPLFERIELFPAGWNGVALYRIPGIVCTPQGTLLAYCEARRHGRSDWGEIEVHLRRSTDGGKSWGDSQLIAHRGPRLEIQQPQPNTNEAKQQTVNNPVAIIDRTTGSIEMVYCVNYAHCFSMRSLDDGISWSQPLEITAAFEPLRKAYDWKVIATGPGHGIQLSSGRLVVPIWLAYGKQRDHAPSATSTIFSDDHGQSWQAGEIAVSNNEQFINPNETMITQSDDGQVILLTRSHSRPNRKIITTSTDGASHWSTPRFNEQLLEPICMASILAVPGKPATQIFSGAYSVARDSAGREIPGGRGKRENLSILVSYDDGRSWPVKKTVDAGPSAYSDLAALPDGTIVCLYEAERAIVVVRFNWAWIQSPTATASE